MRTFARTSRIAAPAVTSVAVSAVVLAVAFPVDARSAPRRRPAIGLVTER